LTLLITGGSGKLGRELLKLAPSAYSPTHGELDITDSQKVTQFILSNTIDVIVHCAALTSVRRCEESRQDALAVNVEGTKNLVYGVAKKPQSYFVYISTACVFPGDQPDHFYDENDVPYPKNFYGLTKLLGEYIVKQTADLQRTLSTLIVRTNFVSRGKWPHPSAFVDRFGTYLYVDQVAAALMRNVEERRTGVVHICGNKRISMYDIARLEDVRVEPMTLDKYRGPPLTVNMCLSSTIVPPLHFP